VRKITAKYQGYRRIKTVIKNQEVDIMKRRKNILAVLLAVTVMATAMPGSAIAAPVDGQTTEVSAKAGTEKAEKKEQIRVISITDPKLEKGSFARGTKVKDMKLPDKLSARGYKEKDSKKAEDIKIKDVTWKTDYKEDSTAGKYTFTAQITDDYKLAKDVVLPKLTIEITEAQTKTTEKQPETKAAETKQPETKATEAKKPETKTTEKTPEVKKPETKVTEKETEVRKPETKATEKKPETKISEKQPETKADAKAKDVKSTESEKESETKQSETKESETKQSETKESETKESETENTNLKITAFEVKDAKVTIDEEKQTITVLMQKSDTDLKKLAPKITVPAGVTVDPASEKEVDFSASDKIPVIYKLTRTAEDGKTVTREYKVTATICKHDWKEATCTEAAICKLCGVTGAAALGHDWKEATCTEAAVCKRCGIKGSAALGHDWTKATCKVKSTCKRCKITRGKLAAHTWSKWKVTDEATHEKKGKKERKCGICKKKETKTLPKINWIGETDNNKIEGLTNGGNYATGANITFKAVGDRMDNKAPIEGDVRYLPVSWTCGTGKGDLNETNAYARTLQFTTAGTYTLNVTYERQLYKDGKWIAKGDADVQTVQLNVTGNTITNSTNKGASGSNSNVRVAAVTGDNSPIVLLSIVLAASLAALIALFVSGIRRKNNRK
jgi:chemotaxis protein histidine kinase CheA